MSRPAPKYLNNPGTVAGAYGRRDAGFLAVARPGCYRSSAGWPLLLHPFADRMAAIPAPVERDTTGVDGVSLVSNSIRGGRDEPGCIRV